MYCTESSLCWEFRGFTFEKHEVYLDCVIYIYQEKQRSEREETALLEEQAKLLQLKQDNLQGPESLIQVIKKGPSVYDINFDTFDHV